MLRKLFMISKNPSNVAVYFLLYLLQLFIPPQYIHKLGKRLGHI